MSDFVVRDFETPMLMPSLELPLRPSAQLPGIRGFSLSTLRPDSTLGLTLLTLAH